MTIDMHGMITWPNFNESNTIGYSNYTIDEMIKCDILVPMTTYSKNLRTKKDSAEEQEERKRTVTVRENNSEYYLIDQDLELLLLRNIFPNPKHSIRFALRLWMIKKGYYKEYYNSIEDFASVIELVYHAIAFKGLD